MVRVPWDTQHSAECIKGEIHLPLTAGQARPVVWLLRHGHVLRLPPVAVSSTELAG